MKLVKNKHSKYELLLTVLLSICLLVISYNSIDGKFREIMDDDLSSGRTMYFALLFIVLSSYSFLKNINYKFNSISILLLIFVLYFFLIYSESTSLSIRQTFSALVLLLWVFSFSIGQDIASWRISNNDVFLKIMICFVIIPIIFRTLQYYFSLDILSFNISNDAIFGLVVYLPFVFMLQKSKYLKTILIALFILISFLSYKRSIILASVIGALIYIIIVIGKTGIKKYLFSWYFIVLSVVVVYLYSIIGDLVGERVLFRFESMSTDGGSGRDVIYDTLLRVFSESNIFSNLFGHGYGGTRKYVGVLAHNDLVQLLFDFGILGALLYAFFLIVLIKMIVKRNIIKKAYINDYAAYVATIVVFLILSMTNCFIYSFSLMAPLMLAIGILYRKLNSTLYK